MLLEAIGVEFASPFAERALRAVVSGCSALSYWCATSTVASTSRPLVLLEVVLELQFVQSVLAVPGLLLPVVVEPMSSLVAAKLCARPLLLQAMVRAEIPTVMKAMLITESARSARLSSSTWHSSRRPRSSRAI